MDLGFDKMESNVDVELTDDQSQIQCKIKDKIDSFENEEDGAFSICDLGDIVRKNKLWNKWLPRVEPFYAVKCNDLSMVLKFMADMGLSFDCASKAEIQKVLDLGVSPSRIIFANPCKPVSFLKFAAEKNVSMMTFDCEDELHKIKSYYPSARLVIRIKPPTRHDEFYKLGVKFGCSLDQAFHLIKVAKNLKLKVVGVSFHVGSCCQDTNVFKTVIAQASSLFEYGLKNEINMDLLDIGGGFPGEISSNITFEEMAVVVKQSLDKYFPDNTVRIIAEPGRFYVASAFTLVTNIITKKIASHQQEEDDEDQPSFMYYVGDGFYGSFSFVANDDIPAIPHPVKGNNKTTLHTSSIWGPTCDGLDCIVSQCKLPELHRGDWIYFRDVGAYSFSVATNFNGMPEPKKYYICSKDIWESVYPYFTDICDKDNDFL